jgi:hypothetical protein
MASLQNGKLTQQPVVKWQVDEMESWQNGKLMKELISSSKKTENKILFKAAFHLVPGRFINVTFCQQGKIHFYETKDEN